MTPEQAVSWSWTDARPREFFNDADVAQSLTGKLAARRILLAIIANRLNTPNAYEA
jgi:hypothetical protein